MDPKRRRLLQISGAASAAGAVSATMPAAAAALSSLGVDAASFGVRPDSPDDQTAVLQRAIDRAAETHVPLVLGPGTYRTAGLKLGPGSQLVGVRGATRLIFGGGDSLLMAVGANAISIVGLVLDGMTRPLPPNQGLIHIEQSTGLDIADCVVMASGGHGIRLAAVAGSVTRSTIMDSGDVAVFSSDARGLTVANNTIRNSGNNGIVIIRSQTGADGSFVLDNRIENTRNRSGGSGQFGNAINAYRAADVTVRGNLIRGCYTGVRGNTASNIHIVGNTVHDAAEVALYSEFAFEGAVIAQNIVDTAQTGVSVANMNEGGRLACVQGNLLRNLAPQLAERPTDALLGLGIHVEADASVTGNVVENAAAAGIAVGWGRFLRDVAITGNVVRAATIGIAVSAVTGAGSALISGNLITRSKRGAILGMDHVRPVTADLALEGAKPPPHLTIFGNRTA